VFEFQSWFASMLDFCRQRPRMWVSSVPERSDYAKELRFFRQYLPLHTQSNVMRRQGRKLSSSCSKSPGHNFIHSVSLNCHQRCGSVRFVTVLSFVEKMWKATAWRVTWALCQSRISGDVSRYHGIEQYVLSVAPKLSHSCFVQSLLYD
jgi:hypothetical protein